MSFLKISDPAKREIMVQEFLKTRQNIQQNNLAERVGDMESQRDLSKFFKPLTTVQEKAAHQAASMTKDILAELKPLRQGIQDIPKAITFPQLPDAEGPKDDVIGANFIGPIAEQYLRKFVSKDGVDKTYGLYDRQGKFYIGDKQVNVIEDKIVVGDDEYHGTPGLWELLVSQTPDGDIYTEEDYNNYAKIMIKTNSIRKGNDSNESRPKASKGWKWKNIMRSIWDNRNEYEGSGVSPADPNDLLNRFDLLMASKAAGNTGVKDELVTICNQLKTQRIINKKTYKNFISQL